MRNAILTLLLAWTATGVNAQTGSWKGSLDIQGLKLPLVFHFASDGCTVDSPSQGVKGVKAEKTAADDHTVKVTIPTFGAVFEGKNCGDSICGTFRQNGMALPLTLTPGSVETKRPQTPTAPFPYGEEAVRFTNGQFVFNGTLTLPQGYTGKTPVVLMVTGSGQQNRDEELFEHKPFAVIADALARHGIASLRYDDRGYGDPSVRFTDYTTDDFKQDAEAGIRLLRARFDKVGVLGHSEGGTIALMLGAEGKADFLVSLAGMAVSGKETLLQQNRYNMASMGLPAETVEGYCRIVEKIFTALAEGQKLEDIRPDNVPPMFEPVIERVKGQLSSPYMQHFLKVDISRQLPLVKCPVLALNGLKDTQVDCTANIKALEEGLKNCKHTVRALEGLNHLFQHCQTGSLVEYQQIEETISPEVLDLIVTWIPTVQ